MTIHNQPSIDDRYENQSYDPDIEEFQGLINPFVDRKQGMQDHPDEDFEPRDPGWPYPDVDFGFDNPTIHKRSKITPDVKEEIEDQALEQARKDYLSERDTEPSMGGVSTY